MSYRENSAISQSYLKRLITSGPQFMDIEVESSGFVLGDLVDTLVTEPDKVRERFFVMRESAPTGQMGDFVNFLYQYKDEYEFEHAQDMAYAAVGFKRDSIDKVKERFLKEGSSYYNALIEAEDKTVVSPDDYSLGQQMASSILDNHYYKELIAAPCLYKQKELYSELYGDVHSINAKGLLDILTVSENSIKIIDVKTTSYNINKFDYTIRKYKYDFQMAYYHYLTTVLVGRKDDIFKEHWEEFGWEFIPPIECYFVVVDKYNNVVIYKLSNRDLDNAYREVYRAIDSYSVHKRDDDFSAPLEMLLNSRVETACYEL